MKLIIMLSLLVSLSFSQDTKISNFDLFVMSGCPYGDRAIGELLKLKESGFQFNWNLWFIGSTQKDTLTPALQDGDTYYEEYIEAVFQLFPNRFDDFYWLLHQDGYDLHRATKEMGLDTMAISNWVHTKGDAWLSVSYKRSEVLGISASPTLIIDNMEYPKDVLKDRILVDYCKNSGDSSLLCDTIGECLEDYDCENDSLVGMCTTDSLTQKGTCHYTKDIEFTVYQILPNDDWYSEDNRFTATTKVLFPSSNIITLIQGEKLADTLIAQYGKGQLPLLLFDTTLIQSKNYNKVKDGVVRVGNYYLFKDGVMAGGYFYRRPKIKGVRIYMKWDLEDFPQYYKMSNYTLNPWFSVQDTLAYKKKLQKLIAKKSKQYTISQYYKEYLDGLQDLPPVFKLIDNRRVDEIISKDTLEESIKELH